MNFAEDVGHFAMYLRPWAWRIMESPAGETLEPMAVV
jgi:hypothetical protein